MIITLFLPLCIYELYYSHLFIVFFYPICYHLHKEVSRVGAYFNPGNSGFTEIVNSDYVDKTGLIELINHTVGTTGKLTCISRPRRFGKSYAAKMLCAYYDMSCDSHGLFDNLKIAEYPDYRQHLNQYNVICFDVTSFISAAKRLKRPLSDVPNMIVDALHDEIVSAFPVLAEEKTLSDCLIRCAEGVDRVSGRKFIFIIDEWDALIREAKNDPLSQDLYLNLLREWFKNISFTPKAVAAAYITGILPIRKDGSQSAISDFQEYSVLFPGKFAVYTGFTEEETRQLCQKHSIRFDEVKSWYDGYDFPGTGAIYNPYSVMCAAQNGKCRSYWQRTSAAESLLTYIRMDFDGLQEIIARLIAGEEIEVNVNTFENDFERFKSKDDICTLLVHLGYLTYNEEENSVRIPNEEVRTEFRQILTDNEAGDKWMRLIRKSQKLLNDTIAGDETAVAQAISDIRNTQYAPTFYNNEQALRYVIKFAYIAAMEQYIKVEELPSGHGIADIVYIPKRHSPLPALVIELKWDKSSEGALQQIREHRYPEVLKEYGGDIVLAGINYSSSTNTHSCRIEKMLL